LPLPDESVDVVFGAAILHHLDLDAAARETRRVLRPNGRAIFEEPVRNSRFLRFARRLIPYRAPDVSPFERPLTDAELTRFGQHFRAVRSRAFELPHVRLAAVIRCSERGRRSLSEMDRRLLDTLPALRHYAAIRVVEFQK
jgi:SAM-dependent methyltransferase